MKAIYPLKKITKTTLKKIDMIQQRFFLLFCQFESLIQGLLSKDIKKCLEIVDSSNILFLSLYIFLIDMTGEEFNKKDSIDNTCLFIEIKLCRRNPQLIEIVKECCDQVQIPMLQIKRLGLIQSKKKSVFSNHFLKLSSNARICRQYRFG